MEAPKINEIWQVQWKPGINKKENNIIVRIDEDKKEFNPINWRCNDFKCEYEGKELIVHGMNFIELYIMKINTMVKFDYNTLPIEYKEEYIKTFPENEVYIFMGDIEQMPGHCILCNFKTGKMIIGYHTDNFIPLTEDEI